MDFADALAYLDEHMTYQKTGRIDAPSTEGIAKLCAGLGDPQHPGDLAAVGHRASLVVDRPASRPNSLGRLVQRRIVDARPNERLTSVFHQLYGWCHSPDGNARRRAKTALIERQRDACANNSDVHFCPWNKPQIGVAGAWRTGG